MTRLREITSFLRARLHVGADANVDDDRAISRIVAAPQVSSEYAERAQAVGADLVVAYDPSGLYASAAGRPLAPEVRVGAGAFVGRTLDEFRRRRLPLVVLGPGVAPFIQDAVAESVGLTGARLATVTKGTTAAPLALQLDAPLAYEALRARLLDMRWLSFDMAPAGTPAMVHRVGIVAAHGGSVERALAHQAGCEVCLVDEWTSPGYDDQLVLPVLALFKDRMGWAAMTRLAAAMAEAFPGLSVEAPFVPGTVERDRSEA